MSHNQASLAQLDSYPTTTSQKEVSILQQTLHAILNPARLAALNAVDVAPVNYNRNSFFSHIFSIRGRNFSMMIAPLFALLLWGIAWQLAFVFIPEGSHFQLVLAEMDDLITPLITPLSFLLTFRLGRAAVRFWDARRAAGKMIEICRANAATVSAAFMAPIRYRKRGQLREQSSQSQSIDGTNNGEKEKDVESCERANDEEHEEDVEALELMCEYARWLTVFPVALKQFLRAGAIKGWESESHSKKRRFEIGPLLPDGDARNVIMEYDDENGKPTYDSNAGTRARDPPLVVLNRLHQLAYDVAHFTYSNDTMEYAPSSQAQAILYQQITDQINILCGAYGAMERIRNTPLPFVYAIHLRTFLILYLFLWNLSSVAKYGWGALPFLFLLNWALLGIEAAAVECENPFGYNPNHLTLGKMAVVVATNVAQALKEIVK